VFVLERMIRRKTGRANISKYWEEQKRLIYEVAVIPFHHLIF
jgi:hypothetical protein